MKILRKFTLSDPILNFNDLIIIKAYLFIATLHAQFSKLCLLEQSEDKVAILQFSDQIFPFQKTSKTFSGQSRGRLRGPDPPPLP